MGKTRDLFKKIRYQGNISCKDGLNEVQKATRPSRYDLNQIPYDYTVEVTNIFKGLDLINRVPGELWMEVRDIIQKAIIKKNKCKK